MIVHYREENLRLQNVNEELEDKIKDLTETLNERDYSDDPCDSVKYIRNKIKDLRMNFASEKKQYFILFVK